MLSDHGLDADDLSAAVVSLDPQTGAARSVVGGPDISSQSFNAAVRARRQVGSTFKAFTLTAWLEDGKSPESRFDAPAAIEVGDDHEINDYAGRDRGTITLFEALAVSANTVFAQVQQELGPEPIIDVATRLGLPEEYPGEDGEPRDAFSRVPTMTLGVDGFTPFEMAEAFNTYAAEGLHTSAHTIVRVETADGEVLYEANEDGDAPISANDARTATEAMRRVITSGTGTGADIGRPAAGKTGTTQGGADGWFAGYTPDLTTVAWVGRQQRGRRGPVGRQPARGPVARGDAGRAGGRRAQRLHPAGPQRLRGRQPGPGTVPRGLQRGGRAGGADGRRHGRQHRDRVGDGYWIAQR